jgi:transposase
MGAHQRFLLTQQVGHIDALDEQIAVLSAEVAQRLAPFAAEVELLDSIPGIGRWTAEVILAEIGTDMTRFPTAGHLASWAGMCPGNHESAGKRRSGRIRPGNPWLRVALTEAAYAAGRSKETALAGRYHRLIGRRGQKRAAIAVGRTILELCHELLRSGQLYDDPLAHRTLRQRSQEETTRLVRRLERLGHEVTLRPVA